MINRIHHDPAARRGDRRRDIHHREHARGPRLVGPPLHHHAFDEAFYILEGELTFQVEEDRADRRGRASSRSPRAGWPTRSRTARTHQRATCSSARRPASSGCSRGGSPRPPGPPRPTGRCSRPRKSPSSGHGSASGRRRPRRATRRGRADVRRTLGHHSGRRRRTAPAAEVPRAQDDPVGPRQRLGRARRRHRERARSRAAGRRGRSRGRRPLARSTPRSRRSPSCSRSRSA